jgi:MFS family permease
MRTFHPKDTQFGVLLAFFLMPLSGLGTDIYLPSLPAMAEALHTSTAQIQFSLTIFLIGYALGQLVIGNFLDSFGRWKIGTVALFLFGLASLMIAFVDSVAALHSLRLVQGVMAAVVAVAKRTFFVDLFSGEQLRGYLSSFTIIWSLGPIVAPFIGGYLQIHFGWQANFIFLAAYAWLALALELWRGGETLAQRQSFVLADIASRYRYMLAQSRFNWGLLNIALPYSATLAFSMVSPFLIERSYGFGPQVTGWAALLMGLAWMTGGFVARGQLATSLLTKHKRAFVVMLLASCAMLLVSMHYANIYTLLVFAFIVHASGGMAFNIYFTECLGMFPQFAGLSGGLVGGIAFFLTSVLSYGAVTALQVDSQWLLALVYVIFALGLGGTAWLAARQKINPEITIEM